MAKINPVFLELTEKKDNNEQIKTKGYFLGKDLDTILKQTNNCSEFTTQKYTGEYKELPIYEICPYDPKFRSYVKIVNGETDMVYLGHKKN